MTETAPRRGRPGYDQEAVLRTAIALFNRQGYDGTSMGDLAAELGVTKSAIYHHVPSKEHLLGQALDEALDGLEAAISAAEQADGTAYDRLRSVVRQSVEVLLAHQPAVTLLLRVRGNSETETRALARRRKIDQRLARLVQAAVAIHQHQLRLQRQHLEAADQFLLLLAKPQRRRRLLLLEPRLDADEQVVLCLLDLLLLRRPRLLQLVFQLVHAVADDLQVGEDLSKLAQLVGAGGGDEQSRSVRLHAEIVESTGRIAQIPLLYCQA